MTCPHGDIEAACLDCLEAPPAPDKVPRPTQRLVAARWREAQFDGSCARNHHHRIEVGDRIGEISDVGWSCEECAS